MVVSISSSNFESISVTPSVPSTYYLQMLRTNSIVPSLSKIEVTGVDARGALPYTETEMAQFSKHSQDLSITYIHHIPNELVGIFKICFASSLAR